MRIIDLKAKARALLDEALFRLVSRRPSAPENARAKELRSRDAWTRNRYELMRALAWRDPRNFLRWDVVRRTMFHDVKKEELIYLQLSKGWEHWKSDLVETRIGNPPPYARLPSSSANLVHYAYSLERFDQEYGLDLAHMSCIFEFGGGYGGMAALCRKRGFKGTYIIFDFPEFSSLQRYYLSSQGIAVSRRPTRDPSVVVLSSVEDLAEQFKLVGEIDLCIATWSLSESPMHVRDSIVSIMPRCMRWLIAYQETFGGEDNKAYFDGLRDTKRTVKWSEHEIAHLPRQRYLFGKEMNAD